MNIWQIILRLAPFVKPYKYLVVVSLFFTLIDAVAAQINPLVLQKNHIFKGSIEENIRYGNMSADFAEIETAARNAYLHDQIEQLPRKYGYSNKKSRVFKARLFLILAGKI